MSQAAPDPVIAEGKPVSTRRQRLQLYGYLALGLLWFVALWMSAWLSDDAFITLRTVDNFVHGYGLRWNVVERVQSYTHPLWLAVLLLGRCISTEVFFSTLAISIVISLLVWGVLVARFARGLSGAVLVTAVLVCSRAFTDFSTSGLENPLIHLLLLAFVALYLGVTPSTQPTWLTRWPRLQMLVLLSSLLLCTRMDLVPLLLPALLHEGLTSWRQQSTKRVLQQIVIGGLPLLGWELFSLFYYGFPLPNTAYAKLGHGIGRVEMISQGLRYLLVNLEHDWVTSAVIVGGFIALAVAPREQRRTMLGVGAVLQLAYIVWVGGDFMVGRFLTAPFLVLLVPLVDRTHRWVAAAATGILLFVLAPTPRGFVREPGYRVFLDYGMSDEWTFYHRYHGLTSVLLDREAPEQSPSAIHAREAQASFAQDPLQPRLLPCRAAGYYGFLLGPDVHLVDLLALSDPLLARLPATRDEAWRIGHFARAVPEGYQQVLAFGKPPSHGAEYFRDPALGRYYSKLTLITRGDLLSLDRLLAIARFNLGLEPAPAQ